MTSTWQHVTVSEHGQCVCGRWVTWTWYTFSSSLRLYKLMNSVHEFNALNLSFSFHNPIFIKITLFKKKSNVDKGQMSSPRLGFTKNPNLLSKHRNEEISSVVGSVRAWTSSSMAMFLKRSFSYRNFFILRNLANPSCKFSFIVNDPSNSWTSETPGVFALPPSDFIRESRRGFAKARKSSNRPSISYYT